jgi:hypothetical protein
MLKYFSDKNVIKEDVSRIDIERVRVNLFSINLKMKDETSIELGNFSGETANTLVEFWMSSEG